MTGRGKGLVAMIVAKKQDTVNEEQNHDLSKSPLATSLFRHLEEYYPTGMKQVNWLNEDGLEVAGLDNGSR